ncbi:hypothetical protein B0H14DRAFT_3465404 [Mycena olivaceomarginata]|nr:hypothetical protein B0H14DRAFT_3465404 [Mycena olivaceomarginata]
MTLNEDGKLAVLHSTGGLQKLLSKLRSDLNDHDVVALAKLAAYTEEIGFMLLSGDKDAQMVDVSIASRAEAAAASIGKAEKVYKGRNMPQPEVIDLTTLPVKKREQVLRQSCHQKSVDDTHSLQDITTDASNEDVGVDIYREKSGCSKVFGWRRLDVILSEGNFIIKNYPASVCHPAQMPATQATSVWRVAEHEALRAALAARTSGPHQGLHVERRKYKLGAVVIYPHDYTLTPPEDLGPNLYHCRVVQLQEHDVNLPTGAVWIPPPGTKRTPSTTLPPTSITRRVTQSRTTATATSSSSAGPPNASPPPRNSHQRIQGHYTASRTQPIGRWYEVDNAVFGCLGMKGPVEPPADDAAFGTPLPPANNTALGAPPPPANDTALGTPPLASFGLPGPLLSAVLLAGLPTTSVGPTAPALPTPSAPIVPAAPAIPFDPAAVVSAVAQIDQFMAAFKGYYIEDIAAALQNIKK